MPIIPVGLQHTRNGNTYGHYSNSNKSVHMKRFWLILLVICWADGVLTQDRLTDPPYLQWYNQAESLYHSDNPTAADEQHALELYQQTARYLKELSREDSLHTDCLIKAGNIYQGLQQYENAKLLYREAINQNQLTLQSNLLQYLAVLYLGSACYYSNVIDSAKLFFEEADQLATVRQGLPDLGFLYNSLGTIYYESANYIQAKNYFEKALYVTDSTGSDFTEIITSFKTNIATCQKHLGQEKEAIALYTALLQVLSIQEPINSIQQLSYKVMYNTGNSYYQEGLYDSALWYYNKMAHNTDLFTIKKLNDIGRIYAVKQEWQTAERYFDSAIALNKTVYGTIRNRDRAYSFLFRAMLAQQQQLIDEAISWSDYALQEIRFDPVEKDASLNAGPESRVLSPITFFEIVYKKAELLGIKYVATGQEKYASAAVDMYMQAVRTAHFIKKEFDNDEARLFFNTINRNIYQQAADFIASLIVSGKTDYAESMLIAMEDYKGSIMYQNLQQIELKDRINIDPSLFRREKELKNMLAFYYTRVNNNLVETEVDRLRQKIIDTEIELSRIQKQYETDPQYSYYKSQYSLEGLTLQKVMAGLGHETAVIHFLAVDSAIYGMALSSDDVAVIRIPNANGLQKDITMFIEALRDQTEGKRYSAYDQAARLYTQLLQPFERVTDSRDKLVIMPDGILNYLSFEALQTGDKKNYLVQEKTITYHYSISLLLQNGKTDKNGNIADALVFAPFTDASDAVKQTGLPVLFHSANEINGISGMRFIESAATKSAFLQQSPDKSILHLATHARVNTDSFYRSCVVFYPTDSIAANYELYLQEIYNLDLAKTNLVVLSACETAGGINSAGEGLLSLSRAFLYAGSDGIVSTLWKTEDHVTAWIMQRFHDYLEKGYPSEKALRQAKLDFLNNSDFDAHFKTPNYWSNFMYAGYVTQEPTGNGIILWISGIVFVFVAAFVVFPLNRKKIPEEVSH